MKVPIFFDVRLAASKEYNSEPDERLVRLCAKIVGKVSVLFGYGRPKCNRDGGTSTISLDALVQWGMVVPEDGRDGLFVACWKLQSARVQKKLLEKFERWIEDDPDFGSSTGEAAWLGAFLAKWMREGKFPYDRLESLVRWHLAQQSPKFLDEGLRPRFHAFA